jgi:glycosyltransferase involved in cell wall biosynthesis
MLEALRQHYPGAVGDARVIPNGRDAALFRPQSKGRYVLAAGRVWDEAKNIAAVEKAAAHLKWPVYVAGDRGRGAAPVPSGVLPLGRLSLPDLAHFYGCAPIYALPARYEPFGLSVLEAAMAGCALVLGDIPSLRENWSGAAVFVPPDDAEALHAALKKLIADARLRVGLRARARLRARRFTPQRMVEAYLSAYWDVAAAERENTACA